MSNIASRKGTKKCLGVSEGGKSVDVMREEQIRNDILKIKMFPPTCLQDPEGVKRKKTSPYS